MTTVLLYRTGLGSALSTRVLLYRAGLGSAGATPPSGATVVRLHRLGLVMQTTINNQGPIINLGGPASVASGEAFTLAASDADTDGAVVSRAWYAGTSATGTPLAAAAVVSVEAPVVAVDTPVVYTYAATDDGGVTTIATVTVTVKAAIDFVTQPDGSLAPLVWRQ